jgi:hypothetical protein
VLESLGPLGQSGSSGLQEQFQSVNTKSMVVIVDTTVTNMNSSDKGNGTYSDPYKYEMHRTISYFCAFNLCNSPSNFTVITDKVEMDYNMTGMFDFLLNENEMSSKATASGLTGGSSRFELILIFLFIAGTLQCSFIGHEF